MKPPSSDLEIALLLVTAGTDGTLPPGVQNDAELLDAVRRIPEHVAAKLPGEVEKLVDLRRQAPAEHRPWAEWVRVIASIAGWPRWRAETALSLGEAGRLFSFPQAARRLPS